MQTCGIRSRRLAFVLMITEGTVFRGVDRQGNVAAEGLHRDSIAAIFKTAAALPA
jgi:hypothetical protein